MKLCADITVAEPSEAALPIANADRSASIPSALIEFAVLVEYPSAIMDQRPMHALVPDKVKLAPTPPNVFLAGGPRGTTCNISPPD